MNRRRALGLVGALLVAIAIVSVSTPNLLRSRIAANEATAVGSVRSISTAAVTYSAEHPREGYPQRLSDLAPYLDPVLASGTKSGYSFRFEPGIVDTDGVARSFRVDAVPIAAQTGTRSFSANETGVISSRAEGSNAEMPLDGSAPQPSQPAGSNPRRTIHKDSLNLIVSDPAAAVDKVRGVAAALGGYVDTVRYTDDRGGARQASIAIRVPVGRVDEARREVRAIGERVHSEEDAARDVTGQYVDLQSTLRNYQAEEAQYLEIMRRSGSIKDTLAVAERLADVRGRIERTQGQLNLMSHETEMALVEVTLCTEAVAQPVDVRWHPGAEIKAAFAEAENDLTTFANFAIAVAFRLPGFALWAATLVLFAAFGWRVARWTWKWVVPSSTPAA